MSLPAHVEIIGSRQGEIKGSCDMKNREGTIFVSHIHHKIEVPTDGRNGKRIHAPYQITKKIDLSSTMLNQALVTTEPLTSVLVKWYRIDPEGHEEHYFTHRLENAIVRSIEIAMEEETVSFSYERITWSWENPGMESSDEWQSA